MPSEELQDEVNQDGFPWHDPGLRDLAMLIVVVIVVSVLSFVNDVMEAFKDAW